MLAKIVAAVMATTPTVWYKAPVAVATTPVPSQPP